MNKIVIFLILSLFLSGCVVSRNVENLNKLEIGMTKDQVLSIMGKPQLREADAEMEWWSYQTRLPMYELKDSDLTPVAFEDGKVIGWGKNFWTTKEQKYDVKIDQTIKQD